MKNVKDAKNHKDKNYYKEQKFTQISALLFAIKKIRLYLYLYEY